MPILQSQFDTLLIPAIYHHFDVGRSQVPALRSRLFNVQSSVRAEERGTGMGGISPDAWDQYRKSGVKGELDMDQLYTQSYVHVEYPVRLPIEKKLILNDQYGEINRLIQRAGLSAETKMELDAVSVLNNAFSASYLGSDAKALCATDHPQSKHKSSGSYGNKGTTALSKSSVAATRLLMQRFKDDRGNLLGLMPNELWVPPELEDTALEIANSILDPASANNAVNAQRGRWQVIPWARLSDTTNCS